MHISRRSTTAALRYGGPFGELVSLASPEDLCPFCVDGNCTAIHSDGVTIPHDNVLQQETLQARKNAVNFPVGKHCHPPNGQDFAPGDLNTLPA